MVTDLVVDLSDRPIETLSDLWDALTEPCGLPEWFGRNLDAWWDTIEGRGISDVIDQHARVVIIVGESGLFLTSDGHLFVNTTNESSFGLAPS